MSEVTSAAPDQLSFGDPVARYPKISPEPQVQPEPGLQQDTEPKPDIGKDSYRGTGRLTGRKALITGGDSGIGAAVAVAFAREGADVALAFLPPEEPDVREVEKIVTEAGRRAVLIPADFTDPAAAAQTVATAVEGLGGLDILVNNAGKQVAVESLEELPDEQVETTFDVNIVAMFRTTREALRHMPAGSTIINTTSIQAYQPSPTLLDYAATKAAINNFTKGLAAQVAERGIRVNAVAPGPIWTPIQPSHGQLPDAIPEFGHNTWLGRAGQPTEVASAFVFLASPESSYVLGETLNVNGGMPTP
ncbi:MAG TPA: SDR family oxidoreductase [Actinomycetaceae bacterium]|nr:SDR family oxidoreductase [Actinomycetaceae bacterium]